jgi:hypothetical protein
MEHPLRDTQVWPRSGALDPADRGLWWGERTSDPPYLRETRTAAVLTAASR